MYSVVDDVAVSNIFSLSPTFVDTRGWNPCFPLLLISINFTPKTSHSCLKIWYTMFPTWFLSPKNWGDPQSFPRRGGGYSMEPSPRSLWHSLCVLFFPWWPSKQEIVVGLRLGRDEKATIKGTTSCILVQNADAVSIGSMNVFVLYSVWRIYKYIYTLYIYTHPLNVCLYTYR